MAPKRNATPESQFANNDFSAQAEGLTSTLAPPVFQLKAGPVQAKKPGEDPAKALADLYGLDCKALETKKNQNHAYLNSTSYDWEDLRTLQTLFGMECKEEVDLQFIQQVGEWQYKNGQFPTGVISDPFLSIAEVKTAVYQGRFDSDLQKDDEQLKGMKERSNQALKKLVEDKKLAAEDVPVLKMIIANVQNIQGKKVESAVSFTKHQVRFLQKFQLENGLEPTGVIDGATLGLLKPKIETAKNNLQEQGFGSFQEVVDYKDDAAPQLGDLVDNLLETEPDTNAVMAKWLLMATKAGFLTLSGRSLEDLIQLMSGSPLKGMKQNSKWEKVTEDGKKKNVKKVTNEMMPDFETEGDLFNGLMMNYHILRSYMNTWNQDRTQAKKVLPLNSLASWRSRGVLSESRRTGDHGNFIAMDYHLSANDLDGFKQILDALPKGKFNFGIGIMDGFFKEPSRRKDGSGGSFYSQHLNPLEKKMNEGYAKVLEYDKVVKAFENPEKLKTYPKFDKTLLDAKTNETLEKELKAWIEFNQKGDAGEKAQAQLAKAKSAISGVQNIRDGFNDTYKESREEVESLKGIKRFSQTQWKVTVGEWNAKKKSFATEVNRGYKMTMSNETLTKEFLTDEAFNALKDWSDSDHKIGIIFPDNPRHVHIEADKVDE